MKEKWICKNKIIWKQSLINTTPNKLKMNGNKKKTDNCGQQLKIYSYQGQEHHSLYLLQI